jgi:hypothetical protein
MSNKLDQGQIHMMRLIDRESDSEGYAPVSKMVLPLVEKLPNELVELVPTEDGRGKARLTDAGKTVLQWS